MISRREWQKKNRQGSIIYQYDGWFLLWIIPLYIRRHGMR